MESHFAALRIPETPEKNLTRAISFSELPTRHRVVFQHAETSGGLVRQYSCEQIYDKASNTRQLNFLTSITSKLNTNTSLWKPTTPSVPKKDSGWHTRIPSLSINPGTPQKVPKIEFNGLNIFKIPLKPSKSPEKATLPHEMDSNSHKSNPPKMTSPKALVYNPEVRQPSSEEPQQSLDLTQMKKKLRPLIPTEFSKPPERRMSLNKVVFFGLISIAVLITSTLISEFNQKPLDFTNTTIELRKNVLGQSEAIEELIDHLQSNFNNFTSVILVGGMGVGKTYTTSIIKEHFPYKYNIFEYFPPLSKQIPSAYESLSHLHCNLVVLENLKMEDVKDFVEFTKSFREQKKRPCVIILGVLNPQVTDDHLVRTMDLKKTVEELQKLFQEEEITGKVIRFASLGSDSIGDCIMREVRDSDVVLDDRDYQAIKAQLLMMNTGCKGAHAKVNLLGKKKGVKYD